MGSGTGGLGVRCATPAAELQQRREQRHDVLRMSPGPIIGAVLAVPLLASFKIICDRIEPLHRLPSSCRRAPSERVK
jgi:hypothetical protein